MSLINMQDGIIKSSLVQILAARGENVARAHEAAQANFHDELSRQADEVVLELTQAENEGIRDDEEKDNQGNQKRRRGFRKAPHIEEDEENGESASSGNIADGPHRIDITI